MTLRYKIVIEPNEEGGFTVTVPDLPGCVTQGDTIEEAVGNAKEAIEGHLEALTELRKSFQAEIEVEFEQKAA